MSSLKLPPVPASLKAVAHLLKTASEHENRDAVLTYWCRLASLQSGMKLDRSSKEALALLLPLMDWLEKEKKVLAENEAITNEVVANAHIENYAIKLFTWADQEDRAERYGKNTVKAFYTAGNLFEVLSVFGELTPENANHKKYAKWKAAYIHNCLKNGERPIPGPAGGAEDDDGEISLGVPPPATDLEGAGAAAAAGGAGGLGWQMPAAHDPMAFNQDFAAAFPSAPTAAPAPVPAPRPSVVPAASTSFAPTASASAASTSSAGGGGVTLTSAQIVKTQKYCKYASSALDYDDRATAITNLQKALKLLQTGEDS